MLIQVYAYIIVSNKETKLSSWKITINYSLSPLLYAT